MSDEQQPAPTSAQPPARKTRTSIKVLATVGVICVVIVLVSVTALVYFVEKSENTVAQQQAALEPFYTPPADIPAEPGSIIRVEEMSEVDLDNGKTFRVLYTSLDNAGKPVAVSGMFWVSTKAVPQGGRRMMAWAHGTVGLADQCAPSRSSNPLQDSQNWLNVAMDQGYAVAATDYVGLGTPGHPTYLIGDQEARDVTYSVRALDEFVKEQTTKEWIVWGHSQGGHSSLWTGELANKIAPERKLIATGAAAPAQQLTVIMQNQWTTPVGWVIGPEALVSFENEYPDGNFRGIVSGVGQNQLDSMLAKCIQSGGIEGLILDEVLQQKFFDSNPIASPAWAKAALDQTPPVLPKSMPVFMSEGTNDQIVLSGSNALMQERWCAAGANLTVEWIGDIGHMQVATASGPAFMEWANDRWLGKPTQPNCAYPPASPPLPEVKVPPEVLKAPISQASVPVPAATASASPTNTAGSDG